MFVDFTKGLPKGKKARLPYFKKILKYEGSTTRVQVKYGEYGSLTFFPLSLPPQALLNLYSIKQRGSRITTVYLEEINDMQHVDFLFTLCPYMKNFKVKYTFYIDFQMFLRTVLNENTRHGNHYLHSLCFHLTAADDQTIENLKKIIRYNQLPVDFTIKRILDKIYLQWN